MLIVQKDCSDEHYVVSKEEISKGTFAFETTFFNATDEEIKQIDSEELFVDELEDIKEIPDEYVLLQSTIKELAAEYKYVNFSWGHMLSKDFLGNDFTIYSYFSNSGYEYIPVTVYDDYTMIDSVASSNKHLKEDSYDGDDFETRDYGEWKVFENKKNGEYYIFFEYESSYLPIKSEGLTAYSKKEVEKILDIKF